MDGPPAVLVLQPNGPPVRQQARVCLDFCAANRYPIVALVSTRDGVTVVRAVRSGLARVVVMAYREPGPATDELEAAVAAAGGRVEYARAPARRRLDLRAVVARWWRQGRDPHEIAELLAESTGDVRAMLREEGFDLPK